MTCSFASSFRSGGRRWLPVGLIVVLFFCCLFYGEVAIVLLGFCCCLRA